MSEKLSLAEAQKILDRAVEKAVEVGWVSAYAVADEGGNLISLSKVDGAPAAAAALAKAKAYLAAVTGEMSMDFGNRMHAHFERFHAYQQILPTAIFPGPGAIPIKKNGKVVGGFSSSLTADYSENGMKFYLNGKAYSREDYVTAYALDIPYIEQHPGDR
jgi:uncharacterized protein GlcG (DUF336 family)